MPIPKGEFRSSCCGAVGKESAAMAWVTLEVWVPSLAWHSGLKDPMWPQLCVVCNCGVNSIPGLGTSLCHWSSHKTDKQKGRSGSSCCGAVEANLTRNHEVVGSIPHSVGYGSSIAMSCGVGCRHGLDLVLLWLWCRQAATVLIRSLTWVPPYATYLAL